MRLASVALALLFVSCGPAVTKVVFAVDPHAPPLEYLDDAKQPAGFDIDLARAVARAAGFTAEFRAVAWDGLFSGLAAGSYDAIVSSVVINDARASLYDFSQPYLNAGQVLVVPKDSRAARLEDLRASAVGALTGAFGADAVARVLGAGALRGFASIDKAFDDLAAGRVAGVVTETPVAAQYTLRNAHFQGRFKIVGQPLTDENYGFVVRKGNTAVLAALNAGLSRVKSDGLLADLASRWLR